MNSEVVVQKQLDCYNSHDLEGFLATYHEDVEILNLIDGTVIMTGLAAMRKRYGERFEVSKVHARLDNRIVIGNKVIDHEHVTFADREGFVKAVAVYEVKDDLIKRVFFINE